MNQMTTKKILQALNALDLIGISTITLMAFFLQFYLHELPCPLCLLQRVGLMAIGFGFLLNMRYYPRPSHYSLSLLAAVFTALAALRQIDLHIAPGTGSYGSALFGLHLYTWTFIVSVLAIIYISVALSFAKQYYTHGNIDIEKEHSLHARWQRSLAHFAFAIFFVLAIANALNVFLICGVDECPDNPVNYIFAT